MSSAVSPYVWMLYFWLSCSAVDIESSTSMFVYKETTSNEMGISPWSDDRGHSWNFAISSAVLLMCALTCFSSGFKIVCKLRDCPIKQIRCTTSYVIYEVTCKICKATYIGSTIRPLHDRAKEHVAAARKH